MSSCTRLCRLKCVCQAAMMFFCFCLHFHQPFVSFFCSWRDILFLTHGLKYSNGRILSQKCFFHVKQTVNEVKWKKKITRFHCTNLTNVLMLSLKPSHGPTSAVWKREQQEETLLILIRTTSHNALPTVLLTVIKQFLLVDLLRHVTTSFTAHIYN